MLETELILLFVLPLEKAGLRYLVSGSIASILYGEPRATMDIDLGIFINDQDYSILSQIYPDTDFYVPPEDVIRIESRRKIRGHYNIIHNKTGYKADFYPSRNHPMLPWAIKNIRRISIGETHMSVAPPEYVILWKLAFYQEGGSQKHLRDICGILSVQGDALDYEIIAETAKDLHLQQAWETVKAMVL